MSLLMSTFGELFSQYNSLFTSRYPYFIMRILLAAIDHNFHLFPKPKQSQGGELAGSQKVLQKDTTVPRRDCQGGRDLRLLPIYGGKNAADTQSI